MREEVVLSTLLLCLLSNNWEPLQHSDFHKSCSHWRKPSPHSKGVWVGDVKKRSRGRRLLCPRFLNLSVALISTVISVMIFHGLAWPFHVSVAQGEIYTWGDGRSDQLGHQHEGFANQPTPRIVDALVGVVSIAEVSCGQYHTVALTSKFRPVLTVQYLHAHPNTSSFTCHIFKYASAGFVFCPVCWPDKGVSSAIRS